MANRKKIPDRNIVSQGLPKKGEDTVPDDQISADLKKFKSTKEKLTKNIKTTLAPVISEKIPVVHTAKKSILSLPSKLLDAALLKKLAKFAIIALLFLTLFYIGSRILTTVIKDSEETDGVIPAPTIGQFRPYQPSIYAEDELMKALDEDIKVLDSELSTTQLKETILNPPSLNFNINFGE